MEGKVKYSRTTASRQQQNAAPAPAASTGAQARAKSAAKGMEGGGAMTRGGPAAKMQKSASASACLPFFKGPVISGADRPSPDHIYKGLFDIQVVPDHL